MDARRNFANGVQSKFECLLFDLDDTLYPPSNGLMNICANFIQGYLMEKLGIDATIAPDLCDELYKTHGTTLAGLVERGYKCDYEEYHRFVHANLPYHVLQPDPILRHLLLSMPQRKIVFTNGDKVHALKALNKLGLEDCFEQLICFDTLNPKNNYTSLMPIICKPSVDAFHGALRITGADASKTLFFDDSSRNLEGAKAAGLWTCLVGKSKKVKGADYAIESIHNVKEAIPEIWPTQHVEFDRRIDDKKIWIRCLLYGKL